MPFPKAQDHLVLSSNLMNTSGTDWKCKIFVNKIILSTKLLNIIQKYTCLLMSLIFSLNHDQPGS